ncbi:MAG: two-component system, chemotaxis family, chemotaxis protein CheY, partial [Archaeoglobi archaeon]|nr:two-component system, chemotaxis family, chemotaxis protein CheY [Archaeoglobi archaeon]
LKLVLEEKYEVITATNGEEAVQLYKSHKPDVVLMDIIMPVMNGVDATREIKKYDPDAKIIGVTAYARTHRNILLKAGALEIVEKPFRRRVLLETIEKYLQK